MHWSRDHLRRAPSFPFCAVPNKHVEVLGYGSCRIPPDPRITVHLSVFLHFLHSLAGPSQDPRAQAVLVKQIKTEY